jgi:2'-5' RNA ligase
VTQRGSARAFVALVPPAEALDALERVLAPVRPVAPPRLTWSRRAQWHLTLQFLGRVDDVAALTRALESGLAGCRPPVLGLGGAGAFPSPARASVVWVGLDQGAEEAAVLAAAVQRATEPLGHEPDDRAFAPHLTVARARRPLPVGSLLASIGDGPVGAAWEAQHVVLMESDTRPSGAVYRERASIRLAGGALSR